MRKKISVVIPTYNRGEALIETLKSLNNQTVLPDEVIIVDESTQNNKKIIKSHHFRYPIKYIWKPSKFRSAARSRNLGIKIAKGDIVLFLDDDVVLDSAFIEEILNAFNQQPNVLGVMGQITNVRKYSLFYFVLNFIFLRFLQHKPIVRRSFFPCYPYKSRGNFVPAEWLSGSNMALRQEILREYEFDWKLMKYSYSEDVDISYRLYRKFKGIYRTPLALVPSAKLVHKHVSSGRLPGHLLEKNRRVINLYMLYKHFGDTRVNIFVFLWWNLGEILDILCTLRKIRIKDRFRHILLIVSLVIFSLKNLSRIKHGEILKFQQQFY